MSRETLSRLSGLAVAAVGYALLARREAGEPSGISSFSGPETAGEPPA